MKLSQKEKNKYCILHGYMISRKNSTEESVCREGTGHPFLAIDWPKISFGFLLDVMKKSKWTFWSAQYLFYIIV